MVSLPSIAPALEVSTRSATTKLPDGSRATFEVVEIRDIDGACGCSARIVILASHQIATFHLTAIVPSHDGHIAEAWVWNVDAVLARSKHGGYYLVGLATAEATARREMPRGVALAVSAISYPNPDYPFPSRFPPPMMLAPRTAHHIPLARRDPVVISLTVVAPSRATSPPPAAASLAALPGGSSRLPRWAVALLAVVAVGAGVAMCVGAVAWGLSAWRSSSRRRARAEMADEASRLLGGGGDEDYDVDI